MEALEIVDHEPPRTYRKMRGNWLTRKPAPNAGWMAVWAALALLFGSLVFWADFHGAGEWMPVSHEAIFSRHEYWRLFTALFAHSDIAHLISNSILFLAFGYFLGGHFGFFVFPFASLAMGGLTNWLVMRSLPPGIELIGVSGAVYWMGAAWLTLHFFLDLRGKTIQRVLRAIGVAVVLFVPETIQANISYRSHFVGFVLGLLFGLGYYYFHRKKFRAADRFETIVEEPFFEDSATLEP